MPPSLLPPQNQVTTFLDFLDHAAMLFAQLLTKSVYFFLQRHGITTTLVPSQSMIDELPPASYETTRTSEASYRAYRPYTTTCATTGHGPWSTRR